MKQQTLTIQEAANIMGVSTKTLRRWDVSGRLSPQRTAGNQRRYSLDQLKEFQKKGLVSKNLLVDADTLVDPSAMVVNTTPQTNTSEVLTQRESDVSGFTPLQPASTSNISLEETAEIATATAARFSWKWFFINPRVINGLAAVITLLAFGGVIYGVVFAQSANGQNSLLSTLFPQPKQTTQGKLTVLAVKDTTPAYVLTINVPGVFSKPITFLESAEIRKQLTVKGGIKTNGADIDAGRGRLTASNVIYSILAGTNVTISGDPQRPTISANVTAGVSSVQGQTGVLTLEAGDGIGIDGLTISNTGVLSLQGETGEVAFEGGDGIIVDGTTISNDDPGSAQLIFGNVDVDGTVLSAASNTDTLRFIAGAGVTLTADSNDNSITIDTSGTGSQWVNNGSDIYYNSGNVGIGTDTPAYQLDVAGSANIAGGLTATSLTITDNTNQIILGSGNTGTITMAALTASRTYTFPDAEGEVCLDIGNCSGLGGTITGSGTAGYVPKFTSSSGVGDSSIYDNGKVGIGTTSPEGLFSVSGGPVGQALVSLNYTGSGENILVGSASGATRFAFDASGNLNLIGGGYQINGSSVLNSTTLGTGIVNSSLTTVAALSSGSIANGFGTILTSNTIQGSDITASGTTGFVATGNGASLDFTGAGTHLINASSGTLAFGAATLNGAIMGNNQSITGLNNLAAGGAVTFGSFTSNGGILYTNGSGVVTQVTAGTANQVLHGGTSPSFGLVALGSDVSGTLPVTSGGTGLTTFTTGDLIYASGVDTLAARGIGAAGQILTVVGGVPTWQDAGGTINFWQRANGVVAPLNITDDLAIGGSSTASAKFQIFGTTGNIASAGDIAVAGTTGYSSTGSGAGLTFSGTGNHIISASSGTLELGALTLAGAVTGNSQDITGLNDLSADGTITFGGLSAGVVLSDGAGQLSSGTVSLSNGTYVSGILSSTNGGTGANLSGASQGSLPYFTSTPGVMGTLAPGTAGYVLTTNGAGQDPAWVSAASLGTNYWQITGGALSPFSSTADVLYGGTSTASAKFAFIGNASGTPTASISANSGNNAVYLRGDGILGTANAQTLQLGSASTGNVSLISGGTNILTGNASGTLTFSSNYANCNMLTTVSSVLSCSSLPASSSYVRLNQGAFSFGNDTADFLFGSASSASAQFQLSASGTSPVASVAGSTSYAAAVIDQTGNGDIFAASKSGATKFVIKNNGDLGLAAGQVIDTLTAGTLGIGTGNTTTLTLGRSGQNINLTNFNNCGMLTTTGTALTCSSAPAGGTNYWQVTSGVVSPFSNSLDMLLGATATGSAKFAFTNVNSGTPTASISANNGTGALYLSGAGNIGTASNQSLTLGGATTGNIYLSPFGGSGSGNVFIQGLANCDTVDTDATGKLICGTDAGGSGSAGIVNIQSNSTPVGSSVDTINFGTEFDVSASPATRANIALSNNAIDYTKIADSLTLDANTSTAFGGFNYTFTGNGKVGIGTAAPLAALDARATVGTLPAASISGNTSAATLVVDQSGDGDIFTASKSGAAKFVITNNGNVGIGIINPDSVLEVFGNGPQLALSSDDSNSLTFESRTDGDSVIAGYTGGLYFGNHANLNSFVVGTNGSLNVYDSNGRDAFVVDPALNKVNVGSNNDAGANSLNYLSVLDYSTDFVTYQNGYANYVGSGGAGSWGIGAATNSSTDTTLRLGSVDSGSNTFSSTQTLKLLLGGILGEIAKGTLDVRGTDDNLPVATFSGQSTGATVVVDQSGIGDLFTASKSGATKFTILNNGNVALANYSNCGMLTTTGTTLTCSAAPAIPGSSYYWQLNNGALSQGNLTNDLLLGGTATSSAKFAFMNMASGTPTASLSAGIAGGVFLTAGGVLQTTNKLDLQIGGGQTGKIQLYSNLDLNNMSIQSVNGMDISDPGAGEGINFAATAANWLIDVSPLNRSNADGNLNLYGTANNIALWRPSMWIYDASNYTTATAQSTGGLDFTTTGSGSMTFNTTGGVGIGTLSPRATLDVRGNSGIIPVASFSGQTAKAALFVDNNGTGDLFTASKSGATKFTITNSGALRLSGEGTDLFTTPQGSSVPTKINVPLFDPGGSGQILAFGLPNGTNSTARSISIFDNRSGSHQPSIGVFSPSEDSLIGFSWEGQNSMAYLKLTTNSAKTINFSFNDIFDNGVPIIPASFSISGTAATAGFAGTTAYAGMFIDNAGTGDLFTASKSGVTRFTIANNGAITMSNYNDCGMLSTVGTTLTCSAIPAGSAQYLRLANGAFSFVNDTADYLFGSNASSAAKFKLSSSGTSPVASVSGSTAKAALIVDNTGTGDLFVASKSGATKFVITNGGNVGIGTSNPASTLDVNGTIYSTGQNAGLHLNAQDNSGNFYSLYSSAGELAFYGGLNIRAVMTASGNFGLGLNNTSPLATFDVRGTSATTPVATISGQTSSAALLVDQSGVGDLFVANKSGANKFTITNSGSIVMANYSNCGMLTTTGTTLTCSSAPAGASQYLRLSNGAFSLVNDTADFLFGNVASSAAKFKLSASGTQPVASVAGTTAKAAVIIDQSGVGDLFTASKSGATKFVITNAGNVGIGTSFANAGLTIGNGTGSTLPSNFIAVNDYATGTNGGASFVQNWAFSEGCWGIGSGNGTSTDSTVRMGITNFTGNYCRNDWSSNQNFKLAINGSLGKQALAALDVSAASATLPVASLSGQTTHATLVVDQSGTGDIFTASKSGATKFVIGNTGNVTSTSYSTSGFKIQDTSNNALLTADTINRVLKTGDINVGNIAALGSGNRLGSDNFESGNLSDAWSVSQGNGGTIASDTTIVRNGKYSAKMTRSGGVGEYAGLYKTILTPQTTVYARTYAYISSAGANAVDFMSIGEAGPDTYVSVYRDDVTGYLCFWNGYLGASQDTCSTTIITLNAWHKIELRATVGTPGTITLWLDGTQIATRTNQTVGATAFDTVGIGDTSAPRTAVIYYDDFVADIVPTGDSANVNIADSLHVAGSGTFGDYSHFGNGIDVIGQSYYSGTAANWSNGSLLQVSGTMNGIDIDQDAVHINGDVAPSAASTGYYKGLDVYNGTGSTNLGSGGTTAMYLANENYGSGTVNYMAGADINNWNSDTGTVTYMDGAKIAMSNSGTIGNYHGLYLANPNNTGTITTNTGLYIENLNTGVSNYGLVIEGASTNSLYITSGKSYFGGNVGIGNANPLNALDVRATSGTTAIASIAGQTTHAALVVDNSDGGDVFTASTSGRTRFVIQQNGNVGIGTTSAQAKLDIEGGNVLIGQKTNTLATSDTAWSRITSGTGTIVGGGTSSIASISAMVNYNGSLYVGTSKSGGAEIYRYNGSSGSWIRVSNTAGTIRSGGTSAIDGVTSMAVYNGYLYVGTTKWTGGAEVYRYEGGSNWVAISNTAGQLASGSTSSIIGVTSMQVYDGALFVGTKKANSAEVYYLGESSVNFQTANRAVGQVCRDGKWDWQSQGTANLTSINEDEVTAMVVNNNQLFAATAKGTGNALMCRYESSPQGSVQWVQTNALNASTQYTPGSFSEVLVGSEITGVTAITSMVSYRGAIYLGIRKTSNADILRYNGSNSVTGWDDYTGINNGPGSINGGTGTIDSVILGVYNGQLYAGTEKSNSAEIYRYGGGAGSVSNWTKVSQTTVGTIGAGGTANIDKIAGLMQYGDSFFAATYDTGNASAELYQNNVVNNQSYALQFHAGMLNTAGGEQANLMNLGSISFSASASGNTSNTGSFLFSHQIITQAGAYDVAEDYATRDESLEVGDIVAVDTREDGMVKKAAGPNDSILGIYSENPALRLSQADTTINGGKAIPVAMVGRVPVKVTSANGSIKPGDELTASDVPGVAVKATKAGFGIGRALASYSSSDPTAIGKVMVYVQPMWYDPGVTLTDSGNVTLNGQPLSTDTLKFAFDDIALKTNEKFQSLEASTSAKLSTIDGSISSLGAQLKSYDDKLSSLSARVSLLETIASGSAMIGMTTQYQSASSLGLDKIDTKDVTVSNTLTVLGRTLLSDVGITGKVTVGLLSIEGLDASGNAAIDTTAGVLKLQSSGLQGLDILNGKVLVHPSGDIHTVGQITSKKVNIDTQDVAGASLGVGILPAGKTSVIINTKAVTNKSAIFVTPKTKTANPLSVTGQNVGKSFIVEVENASSNDIQFNWWVVN